LDGGGKKRSSARKMDGRTFVLGTAVRTSWGWALLQPVSQEKRGRSGRGEETRITRKGEKEKCIVVL